MATNPLQALGGLVGFLTKGNKSARRARDDAASLAAVEKAAAAKTEAVEAEAASPLGAALMSGLIKAGSVRIKADRGDSAASIREEEEECVAADEPPLPAAAVPVPGPPALRHEQPLARLPSAPASAASLTPAPSSAAAETLPEIDEYQEEEEDLLEPQDPLSVAMRELRRERRRIAALEARLAASQADRRRMNREVLKSRQTIAELERALAESRERADSLETRWRAMRSEHGAAQRQLKEMTTKIARVQAGAGQHEARVARVLESTQAQLEKLRADKQAVEEQLVTVRSSMAALALRANQSEQTAARLMGDMEASEMERRRLRSAVATLEETVHKERAARRQREKQLRALEPDARLGRRLSHSFSGTLSQLPSARSGLGLDSQRSGSFTLQEQLGRLTGRGGSFTDGRSFTSQHRPPPSPEGKHRRRASLAPSEISVAEDEEGEQAHQ